MAFLKWLNSWLPPEAQFLHDDDESQKKELSHDESEILNFEPNLIKNVLYEGYRKAYGEIFEIKSRIYSPCKRTVFINDESISVDFPYMVFASVDRNLFVRASLGPITSLKSRVNFVGLQGCFDPVCLGKHYRSVPSLEQLIEDFWRTSFSHFEKRYILTKHTESYQDFMERVLYFVLPKTDNDAREKFIAQLDRQLEKNK